MKGKPVLLTLMMSCCYSIASSHIVTSAHMDLPLAACMKALTIAVESELCSTYEYSSEQVYDDSMPLMPGEITIRSSFKEEVIRTCCTRPCTVTKLLEIC